uniref:Uncharacterized protein n=1 Tax=uncultured organism MedDCM-OCT-S09-C234 TaxID=743648 RepID=D6PL01_9ZZZZ|nr:hypothetical protein [uncultured organism MedDCM-OCT-S09-C234]
MLWGPGAYDVYNAKMQKKKYVFSFWGARAGKCTVYPSMFSLVDKRAWKCSLDDYGDKGALSKLAP